MIDPELDEELAKNGFHIDDEDTEAYVNDAERDFFTAEYDDDDAIDETSDDAMLRHAA